MANLWYIGVAIVAFDTLLGTFGKQLMRLSHKYEEEKRKSWFIFIIAILFVSVLNPLLSIVSYAFASPSLLAPFAGLTIAWNIILSPFVLKEQITKHDIIGSTMIICGIVLISVFGFHQSITYTYDELLSFFRRPMFIGYLVVLALLIIIFSALILFFKPPSVYGLMGYGLLAGCLGGNQYMVKTVMELLKNLFKGEPVYKYFPSYIIGGFALLVILGQLFPLNKGLKYYDALLMLPLYQGSFIIIGSVSGILFFEEYKKLEIFKSVFYGLGIVFVITGIYYTSHFSRLRTSTKRRISDIEETEQFLNPVDNEVQ